ncbi:hypothetical protein AEP_01675 [Curvibacter sp. AEP1-3]|uniref:hypothetical protein n=1 Tax=Curvibacter sp. AEP1-3 TaxID=1844971 RepID=UPI000B57D730|nr:hypothetical protein [Curvibacter sp. AEP1-3]ARV18619.1 hypothetical protein AEP_01675 [Curvibacter sp. AEP1-3]
MKIEAVRSQPYIQRLICDRCGRQAKRDDLDCEFHEFMSIQYRAGFGSIFGDGNGVEVDLCQHCVKDSLGTWIRITDPLADFSLGEHCGEIPSESDKLFRDQARANIARSIEDDDGEPADHVIAELRSQLRMLRSTIRDILRSHPEVTQSHDILLYGSYWLGAPVVTNRPLPNLNLEEGTLGSVVHIHLTNDLIDVEFVTDVDGRTSVKTVDAQWLNPGKWE